MDRTSCSEGAAGTACLTGRVGRPPADQDRSAGTMRVETNPVVPVLEEPCPGSSAPPPVSAAATASAASEPTPRWCLSAAPSWRPFRRVRRCPIPATSPEACDGERGLPRRSRPGVRAAGVVQVRESVRLPGPQMRERRGRAPGHPAVSVCRARGDSLEEAQHPAHLRRPCGRSARCPACRSAGSSLRRAPPPHPASRRGEPHPRGGIGTHGRAARILRAAGAVRHLPVLRRVRQSPQVRPAPSRNHRARRPDRRTRLGGTCRPGRRTRRLRLRELRGDIPHVFQALTPAASAVFVREQN